jgi:hypothetical protein
MSERAKLLPGQNTVANRKLRNVNRVELEAHLVLLGGGSNTILIFRFSLGACESLDFFFLKKPLLGLFCCCTQGLLLSWHSRGKVAERGVVIEKPGLNSGDAIPGVLHCGPAEFGSKGALEQLDMLSVGDESSRFGVCTIALVGGGCGIVVVTIPSLWVSSEPLIALRWLQNEDLDRFCSSSIYGGRS